MARPPSCVGTRTCSLLDSTGGDPIVSVLYAGGRVYVGRSSGVIWNCDPELTNFCGTVFGQGSVSIAISAGSESESRVARSH